MLYIKNNNCKREHIHKTKKEEERTRENFSFHQPSSNILPTYKHIEKQQNKPPNEVKAIYAIL